MPITPRGVCELRIANAESRDVFFVALCRSLGIPSRLEPAEKTPQFFDGKNWLNVYFERHEKSQPVIGFLELKSETKPTQFDPNYYIHFTIGKLNNGVYETLDLGWRNKLSDLPSKLELEEGKYRSITGKRGVDGTVYAHLNHFEIKRGKTCKMKLQFRDPEIESKVFGHLNPDFKLSNDKGEKIALSQLEKQDAIVLMWVEPGKEPTRHLMEEFKGAKKGYENWNGNIAVLQSQEVSDESLSGDFFANMPSNYDVYKDQNNQLMTLVKKELDITGKIEKPLILVLNPEGDIKFASRGYKIGIHEHLLKILE